MAITNPVGPVQAVVILDPATGLPSTGGGGGGSGDASAANQTTGNTSLASIDTKTPTVGQKVSSGSRPVVIASDQSAIPVSGTVAVTNAVLATSVAGLGKAEDAVAASGDVGTMNLGVRGPVTPAAQTSAAGDYGANKIDAEGNQIVKLNAIPDVTWQAVSAAITTTTSTSVKAAAAAGIRNYVTDIVISNGGVTPVASLVTILDGATVIWQAWVPASGTVAVSLTTPLRGSAATAVNVQSSIAATIYASLVGYLGV